MRRTVLLAVFPLLFFAPTALAAPQDYTDDHGKKGALLFTLGGITGTPVSFESIGVGGRYVLGDKLTARGALGLFTHSGETDFSPGDTPTQDESLTRFGLEAGVEYSLFRAAPVSIYTGGLLLVTHQSEEPEDNLKDTATGFGIAGLLGATWFFTQNVSLGAEYRLGLLLDSADHEDSRGNTTQKTETSSTDFGISSFGLLLGFWW